MSTTEVEQDVELNFLSQYQRGHTIGDHELKTSPLVTKDATSISGGFTQRGLLGTVLSVHADGIPEGTRDPRLYLNLDAPSSGLVCGVQGSGKSHTVSCILESSLIVDSRIGSLPAPLGTVVFHFDEENGQRPCEAAYLSALKGGLERGVEEVVVLVSPSNLRTRRRVYSSLKFVQVHPLRIAEKDLNAARMLSMMGCDNLDALPLYLHSALSILRTMGSDDFSYQEFKKQLAQNEFNKAQGAMLQLRMDLLDSFLQGTGPDVTSFFKAGRLVIIDISDPFVEASTAAMLFDICLGLFIEWKSTTGKLIVLDEAHKYLTNADANRFTRTICSIIRQQRHLAARVIISTQEPTVVPPSVLDLLSWTVAHRFSSPSWVGHLKRHVCVQENMEDRSENSASTETTLQWGRKVMTLHTGEAILFSGAAMFATEGGSQATLSTGYAIIRTRPRLTSDGGESLLATEAHHQDNPVANGIPTPGSSELEEEEHIFESSRFGMIPPGTPLPRVIDLVAEATFMHQRGTTSTAARAPPSMMRASYSALPPFKEEEPTIRSSTFVTSVPPASVQAKKAPSKSGFAGSAPASRYSQLIETMQKMTQVGPVSKIVEELKTELDKCNPPVYTGKFNDYLNEAKVANIILLFPKANGLDRVALTTSYRPASLQGSTSSSTVQPVTKDLAFVALVASIQAIEKKSKSFVNLSDAAIGLKKHRHGDYKAVGFDRLIMLATAAEQKGFVVLKKVGSHVIIRRA